MPLNKTTFGGGTEGRVRNMVPDLGGEGRGLVFIHYRIVCRDQRASVLIDVVVVVSPPELPVVVSLPLLPVVVSVLSQPPLPVVVSLPESSLVAESSAWP